MITLMDNKIFDIQIPIILLFQVNLNYFNYYYDRIVNNFNLYAYYTKLLRY